MIRKSIARFFRNNWGLKVNLRYYLYHLYCKFKSKALGITPQDREASLRVHQKGLGFLKHIEVSELSHRVKQHFGNTAVKHGHARLPREVTSSLAKSIYEVIRQMQGPIRAYYKSHFKVNWIDIQRIVPGEQPKGSSFSYHTDDSPYSLAKAFIYLTDTYKDNGAFRAFDYKWTDKFIKQGILKTSQPGAMRDACQHIVQPSDEMHLQIIEGEEGTAFMFDNRLVHKGTLPLAGERIHISLEIMPSSEDFTFEDIKLACSKEIIEYYTLQPFAVNIENA